LLVPGAAFKEQAIYLLKLMTRMMMMKYMMTKKRSRWRQKGRQRRGIRKEYDENDEADLFRPACWGHL